MNCINPKNQLEAVASGCDCHGCNAIRDDVIDWIKENEEMS